MSTTNNLNLTLTSEDDTATTFKTWRLSINGESSDSNMNKIDKAYGDLSDQIHVISDKVFNEAPRTWADVQGIVRSGLASRYFDIGDQLVVEKWTSVTADIGESTGIQTVMIDPDTFISECGEVRGGAYFFMYDGVTWRDEDGAAVENGDLAMFGLENYGIVLTGVPVSGDHVVVVVKSTELVFDIIGIDHDTPADSQYTHSMTLQMHDALPTPMVFDAPEAAFYVDEETYPNGLAAGTYGYETRGDGIGLTGSFTLKNSVPVGGQIKFLFKNDYTVATIETYKTSDAKKPIETVNPEKYETGISTLITLTKNVVNATTNSKCRTQYGSNNWSQSAIRQWLNSRNSAMLGSWWRPQTNFDRPTIDVTQLDGFLKKIDPAFLDIVGNVIKTTQKSATDGYELETTTERFFLLSRAEVYGGAERSTDDADGTVYEYYSAKHSDLSAPGVGADSNRTKAFYVGGYGGSPVYWWLRTPNCTDGCTVRFVTKTGSVGSYYAGSLNDENFYIVPACVIV